MSRTLEFPLQLSVDELAYLLSMLHTTHIPGLKIAKLLSGDEHVRQQQLMRGYEELVREGWAEEVSLEGRTYIDLHSKLVEYITILVDPEAAFIASVKMEKTDDDRGLLVYFSHEKILEVVPLKESIVIRPLNSIDAVERTLVQWLGIPEQLAMSWEVTLSKRDAQVLAHGDLQDFEWEMESPLAELVETRKHLTAIAQLVLMKIRDADIVSVQAWGMLVGGEQNRIAWLFQEMDDHVRYLSCDQPCFHRFLQTVISTEH